MSVTCPSCGASLPSNARFCPRDGTTFRADTGVGAAVQLGEPAPAEVDEARRETVALPTPKASADAKPRGDAKPSGDPLVGRVLDGRYRIIVQLGSGGVGAVYQGEHVETRRRVALKVLHSAFARTDTFRKRFEREARAASRLNHPGCVSVLDFGRVERVEPADERLIGMPYLVMEFVDGEMLMDRIDEGRIAPAEALMIARGVLSALRHAHQFHIVHRDIKPSNIMLASSGETVPLVKLLDFGLAKDTGEDSPDAQQQLTQMGMVFGTPGYLSPEQAGGKQADARADLYSFGVVLFEMICGTPPFVRAEQIDVVRDHVMTPPPHPTKLVPSLSPVLEAAMLKALEKDPDNRFQSAEEFAAALAACPEMTATAANTTPATPSPSPIVAASLIARTAALIQGHRKQLMLAVGSLVVVLVIAVATLFARTPSPPVAAPAPVPEAPPAATPEPVAASARRHLAMADDYARRLWCSDAVDELERALRDSPQLRSDPELTRIAIPCLRTKTQGKTMRFLVESVGADAKPELQAALAVETKPDVREGAQRTLQQLEQLR